MEYPKVTVIIATFNSEKIIKKVLKSIKKQTYPRRKIEILIVDGGSSDNTLKIVKEFGCIFIHNPRTEPVYAKFLGFNRAKGDYALYLDHDEVLENPQSIEKKIKAFAMDKKIFAVIGSGYNTPSNYHKVNYYINEFGDPFSFFIYHLSKDVRFFLPTMKKRYPILLETEEFVIFPPFHSNEMPIIELVAGGSMISLSRFRSSFPKLSKDPQLLPHMFYLMNDKHARFAIAKNDAITHYSAEIIGKYIKKIQWRIKNNIYHKDSIGNAGFSGREKFNSVLKRHKKYFFLIYTFTIIFLIWDTIFLVISRKNTAYFLHFPLTLYTSLAIVYYYVKFLTGSQDMLTSYDGSKKILFLRKK